MSKTNIIQEKIMLDDNFDKYYFAIAALRELLPALKTALLEYFDLNPVSFINATEDDLNLFAENYPELKIPRNFLEKIQELDVDKIYDEVMSSGFDYVTIKNPNYPARLKEIQDYPCVLFYKGNYSPEIFENTLAVVGSRRASENAKSALRRIMSGMQNAPLTIVSGLAYGIDAAAHRLALEMNLRTIGVIGSGLKYQYPSSNADLYKEIPENNLILSEYLPDVQPSSFHFPQRNRIVTGLSQGTLVAEAALKSGAMISANLTLEQGRELMCIPGLITNPNTEGIYKLLKSGAGLVTCADDVYEYLGFDFSSTKKQVELTGDEEKIVSVLQIEEQTMENLLEKTEIDPNTLMVHLTGLELKGLIKQTRGKYFITD